MAPSENKVCTTVCSADCAITSKWSEQSSVCTISTCLFCVSPRAILIAGIAAKQNDPRFEPPFSTVSVGTIHGGTAHNIVPKTCEFQWQVRSLPSAAPAEVPRDLGVFAETALLPTMRRVTQEAAIETAAEGSVPAFVAAPQSEAVALALQLTGAQATHAASYTTEAGLFEQAGVPAVICGPGNIAQAHAADEYVSIAQLDSCMAFLAGLAKELSS